MTWRLPSSFPSRGLGVPAARALWVTSWSGWSVADVVLEDVAGGSGLGSSEHAVIPTEQSPAVSAATTARRIGPPGCDEVQLKLRDRLSSGQTCRHICGQPPPPGLRGWCGPGSRVPRRPRWALPDTGARLPPAGRAALLSISLGQASAWPYGNNGSAVPCKTSVGAFDLREAHRVVAPLEHPVVGHGGGYVVAAVEDAGGGRPDPVLLKWQRPVECALSVDHRVDRRGSVGPVRVGRWVGKVRPHLIGHRGKRGPVRAARADRARLTPFSVSVATRSGWLMAIACAIPPPIESPTK